VPQTELSGLTGTHHQKIDMIFKDVVHYVDHGDKLFQQLVHPNVETTFEY
jgi:hypothetical protein